MPSSEDDNAATRGVRVPEDNASEKKFSYNNRISCMIS
jgi:hypothetical protein